MPPNTVLWLLVQASYIVVFISATIVTGILGWFLHQTSDQNTHVVFQETLAAVTVPVYLGHLVFTQINAYPEQSVLVSLAFSYLWLTSFIFAAQDWTGGQCATSFPVGSSCSQKKAVVAFDFLAFFFLGFGMLIKSSRIYIQNRRDKLEPQAHNNGVINPGTTATENL